jgi:hypothetical protein
MPTETTARAVQSPSDAGDYEVFCDALSASARGRAFLSEYARRNRNADTEQLLAAITRLQTSVTASPASLASDLVKSRLRALLDEISAAQKELEASVVAIRVTKLAELVALVERRITDIMALAHTESLPPAEVTGPNLPDEPIEIVERTHLAIVPTPEQPELPIPSPVATQPPSIALVRSETIMAEVAFVEPLPEPPSEPPPAPPLPDVQSISVTVEMQKIDAAISEPAQAMLAAMLTTKPAKPINPLASIMALKEEERLALFT